MEDGLGLVPMLFVLAIAILIIASLWKVFEKAGKPGWAAIVPIYNLIVLLEIAGRPMWWFILLLIPYVNIIFSILVNIDIAKKFGKSTGFGVGLALLGIVFYPILGFGDARYLGKETGIEDHLVS
ncbi:MAG TPA: DUF5684 domain-containing protein [Saprospiraceae bacterium]|nr:DUF5684 domain-containing protein [Saprospiraceae bacterium]HMQ84211.1 DUF5684 domain-containing protein [Saprospiraceae bacterium]